MERIIEEANNFIIGFVKRRFKFIPIAIIAFDILYILLLMILPFFMALNNVGHFEPINADQMLSYIGSMSTAFCTINLSFMTFWLTANAKRESADLKRKIVLSANLEEELGIFENRLEIPLKIAPDYLNSIINYDVKSLYIQSGRNRETFYKDDFIQIHSDMNTYTPVIVIEIKYIKFKDFQINKYVKIKMIVDVDNEGVITKNELLLICEKEDAEYSYYEIKNQNQFWSW